MTNFMARESKLSSILHKSLIDVTGEIEFCDTRLGFGWQNRAFGRFKP